MRKLIFTLKSIVLCACVLTCTSFAHGQQRTFVSGLGSDANPCTRAAPCRSFQRGHDAVAAGGEVVALDSAGYAAFTITKSVTISGEGIRAALTATAGANGITINAAGATVILRELTITGGGTGLNGVRVNDAATVYIERCVVTSFAGRGIEYNTNGRLFVTDTVVRDNDGEGIFINATGGTARVNIDGSRVERNGDDGIGLCDGTIEASITNTVSSENGGSGFEIDGNVSRANVAHCTAANNGDDGFSVFGDAGNELNIEYSVARGNADSGMGIGVSTIRVSNSVSTNNGTGFFNTGGTFESRQNNTVRGNTTNTSGVITNITGR